jgi:hypothetical protein
MKKIVLLFLPVLLLFSQLSAGQSSLSIKWSKNLGGSSSDFINAVIALDDGSVMIAGYTNSNDNQVSGNHGASDAWVALLDSGGNLLWSKCFGGPGTESAEDIALLANGTFAVVGSTTADGGDVIGYKGGISDGWMIIVDGAGELLQQRCIGGSASDHLYSVSVDADGYFAVAGSTNSADCDITDIPTDLYYDALFLKVDPSLNILWNITEGLSYADYSSDVLVNNAGNYAFCMYDECCQGSGSDFSIYVYNPSGSQLNYYFANGFADYSFPTAMIQKGKDLVIAGYTSDFEQNDMMAVEIKPDGSLKWSQLYDELSEEYENAERTGDICLLSDGRFLLSGGDAFNVAAPAAYVHVLNNKGILTEENSFGGSGEEVFESLSDQKGSTVFAAGYSTSTDGDVPGNFGIHDGWVVKFELTDFACIAPANLITTNISASAAKINWDAVNGAYAYQYRYKKTAEQTWTKGTTAALAAKLKNLTANTEYVWQVRTQCNTNPNVFSDWSPKEHFVSALKVAGDFEDQNSVVVYPHPVTSSAIISFTIQQDADILIDLFDLSGKKVKTIAAGNFDAGNHTISFHPGNLSAGIYFLQLKTVMGIQQQKLIIQ